jgi:hypothetical protein
MVEFASSLGGRLDRVASAADARGLNDLIAEVRGQYLGQPEADAVNAARERCGALGVVFTGLGEVDAKIGGIRRREDVAEIETRVAGLLAEHRTAICPAQEALVRQRSTALTERVGALETEAGRWFEDRKRRVAGGGAFGGLLDELQKPPAFLPSAHEAELQALVLTVQQKLDEDLSGQVLRYFKRITNKDEQKRVVAELQRIVDGK